MEKKISKIELVKEILEIESPELILKIANLIKKEEIHKIKLKKVNEEATDYKTFNNYHRNTKLGFIIKFINLENKEILSKLENILWEKDDFWNELSTSQKNEIESADTEIINGETLNYEDFIAPHLK